MQQLEWSRVGECTIHGQHTQDMPNPGGQHTLAGRQARCQPVQALGPQPSKADTLTHANTACHIDYMVISNSNEVRWYISCAYPRLDDVSRFMYRNKLMIPSLNTLYASSPGGMQCRRPVHTPLAQQAQHRPRTCSASAAPSAPPLWAHRAPHHAGQRPSASQQAGGKYSDGIPSIIGANRHRLVPAAWDNQGTSWNRAP